MIRSIFKERCHACWLKKCLKLFVLPSAYRLRLIQILPKTMRDLEICSETSVDGAENNTAKIHNSIFTNNISTCDNNDKNSSKLLLWNGKNNISFPEQQTSKVESINFKTPTNSLLENNMTFGSSLSMNINLKLLKDKSISTAISTASTDLITNKKTDTGANNTVISNNSNTSNSNINAIADNDSDEKKDIIEPEKVTTPSEESNAKTTDISTSATVSTTTSTTDSNNVKRQRIDLKGPRVKHVCRSASIVLGQPIATFPQENSSESDNIITTQEEPATSKSDGDDCNACVDRPIIPTAEIDSKSNNNKENTTSNNKIEFSKPITRKITRPATQMLNQNSALQSNNPNHYYNTIRKHQHLFQAPPPPQLISIDFWENYDPTEIHRNGFGLILTEEMPIRSLCFLCGSAGQDKLQYCNCCGEPYHQFCIDDDYNIRHSNFAKSQIKIFNSIESKETSESDNSIVLRDNDNSESKKNYLNWLCPRCTVCFSCNMSTGTKVCCQKCSKYYHTTCLLGTSKRLLGTDRPLICTNCLKCKSCNQANVSKFIGNLPLCLQCFRLRQKGNFCPLCQKCYDDNNFDLKMMECGDCHHWVHARCENLTDEQYNMLSILPENIEFICKKCAKQNVNSNKWRDAVVEEFKIALLSVIRLLSKSRQACTLLKLSPRKKSGNFSCVCQPIQSNRSILFDNQSGAEKTNNQIEGINCYCNTPKLNYPVSFQLPSEPNLFDIKQKIISNEYFSLHEFNYDMQKLIQSINSDELLLTYKEILCETFPWFQNETKACTDALEEDMNDSCQFDQSIGNIENDQLVPTFDIPNADMDTYFYDEFKMKDERFCSFCKSDSDALPQEESRLLYCGHNSWVHTNCALWSAEVFEEIDGSLQNVQSALSRGRSIKCCECGQKGASVGCNMKNCGQHYHFPCAKRIGCAFLLDKTVYCTQHLIDLPNKKLQQETNFEVNRSVYIELDRRKRKQIEPKKIQFMIGSLRVRKLGRFIPQLSDFEDYIVPTDFECTRLYWSSKEPWKIVEYTIKTSILNNQNECSLNNLNLNYGFDFGRNFTVDHTMNNNIIQRQLTQISKWHNSLNMTANDEESVEATAITTNNSDDTTNDEEPQNNNDLLPPEIKDAILEDLPHDILEGISMMDIFPKLMTFDDYLPMDFKNDSTSFLDLIKDNNNSNLTTISTNDEESNWLTETINDNYSNACNSNISLNRDIKRNKGEILSRSNSSNSLGGNSKNSKSNINWSSKLESNLVAKRRKINGVLVSLGRTSSNKKTCVTGTLAGSIPPSPNDEVISFQNKDILEKLKISQLDGMDDSMLLTTGPTTNFLETPPVKCDRCHCTYRTQDSFMRHLETCEIMSSTSESESDTRSPDIQQHQQQQTTQIHTSHSITEFYNNNNANNNNLMSMINLQQQQIPISINNSNNSIQISNLNNKAIQNAIPISLNSFPIHQNMTNFNTNSIQNMLLNQQQQQHLQQQQIFAQPIPIGNFQQQLIPIQNLNQITIDGCNNNNLNTQEFIQTTKQQQQQRIISQPQTINIPQQSQIISLSSSTSSSNMNVSNNNNMSQQIMTIGQQQITSSSPQKKQLILPHTANTKKQALPRLQQSPRIPKATRNGKSIQMKKIMKTDNINTNNTASYQIINTTTNMPLMRQQTTTAQQQLQQQQQQNIIFQPQITHQQQPIILQQQQPTNIVSYITADGQYVTLPTTSNGVFQLPTADTSNNLILTTNNNGTLSVIPANSLQLAQPQVIGTIIQPQTQQQTTNGLQCGVEQMILAATGGASQQPTSTLEMVQDPTSGCMYLTTQPIYYGLETIVQNTVMSSQQFVSTATAMQGVLSQNSSFSATTTQVFQASKIEPIVEMPTSYVVMADGNNLNILPQQQSTTQNQSSMLPTIQFPTQQQSQHIQIQQQQPAPQQIQSWKIIDDKPNYIQTQQPPPQQQPPQSQNQQMTQNKSIIKSSPIAMQKIQPQLVNKVIPNPVNSLASPITTSQSTINSNDTKSFIQPMYNNQKNHSMNTAKVYNKMLNKPKVIAKPVNNNLKRMQQITNKQPIAIKPNNLNKIQNQQTKMSNIQSTIMQVSQEPLVQTQHTVLQPQPQIQMKNQQSKQFGTPFNIDMEAPLNIEINHSMNNNQSQITLTDDNQQINSTILIPNDNNSNTATFNTINNQYKDTQQQTINHCQDINSPQQLNQQQISVCYQQQQPQQSQQQQLVTTILNNNNDNDNCNLIIQGQQQITNSNSIQLPTSPYLPYNPNCNIPTNVVTPIQQCNTNINSNATTRPTNRVLPMQTLTQRQSINQEQQNSPVKTKIHIEQMNAMDDIVIVKNYELSPISEFSSSSSSSSSSTSSTTTTATTTRTNTSPTTTTHSILNNFNNLFSNSNICTNDADKINAITYLNNDEKVDAFDKNDELLSHSIVQNQDVITDICTDHANSEMMIDEDEDDSNMRTSDRNTPDIKEKICEILINLNDEEDCNKNTIKIEEESMTTTMENFLNLNSDKIECGKMEVNEEEENCNRTIEESKENLNPLPIISSTFENLKNSHIISEKLKLSSITADASTSSTDSTNSLMLQQQNRMNNNNVSSDNSPKLLYEIQSQDGFTYKSTSIVEIWGKLFEAVQIARKAHGIMQLPEGPLAEMCGVQMLGLKTNALKYLLEQLPGVEKCTKYVPKYHQKSIESNLLQNNISIAQKYDLSEFEELKENANGTARCEPYSTRSEYDMFSWLASRHRKQPIPVVMQSNEDLTIPRYLIYIHYVFPNFLNINIIYAFQTWQCQ